MRLCLVFWFRDIFNTLDIPYTNSAIQYWLESKAKLKISIRQLQRDKLLIDREISKINTCSGVLSHAIKYYTSIACSMFSYIGHEYIKCEDRSVFVPVFKHYQKERKHIQDILNDSILRSEKKQFKVLNHNTKLLIVK